MHFPNTALYLHTYLVSDGSGYMPAQVVIALYDGVGCRCSEGKDDVEHGERALPFVGVVSGLVVLHLQRHWVPDEPNLADFQLKLVVAQAGVNSEQV